MCETVSTLFFVNEAARLLFLADCLLASTRVAQRWVELLGDPPPNNSAYFWATRVHLHTALGHADSRQVWHWLVDQVNIPLGRMRSHCPPGEVKDLIP